MIKHITIIFYILFSVISKSFCQENGNTDSILLFSIDSLKYSLTPININSVNSDFCPIIQNNRLFFVSGRDFQYGIVYSSTVNQELLDLYECEKIDSTTFTLPIPLSNIVNTKFNDGPAYINKQNNLIIFSSNSKIKLKNKVDTTFQKNLQLYISEKQEHSWTNPRLIDFCKPEFTFSHPFLSSDQKTLYFSSDLKGGYGRMDLYSSSLEYNLWSSPVNLGPKINTYADEVFPFISTGNILYFSSNDSNGIGGLDIYSFDLTDSSVSKKHLLEKPLNSEYDDFGIYSDSSELNGYLSSNRIKENKDDIFYFSNKFPYFENCTKFIKPSYCYTFFEESTLQQNDTLGLIYEWNLGDGTKIKDLEAKHCFMKPGTYFIELNIIEKSSDSLFYNETSYEFNIEDSEQVYINCADTVIINTPVLINSFKSKIPGFSIEKYFWNFGDNNYSAGVAGYHIFKNIGEFPIHLGVIAKNDSTGILQNFCIERIINVVDSSWVSTKEITVFQPFIAKNIFSSSEVDSLNFRVYLGSSKDSIPIDSRIFNNLQEVREFKDDSLYRYTSGKSDNLSDLIPNYNQAKEMGFKNAVLVGFSSDSLLPKQDRSIHYLINDTIKEIFITESKCAITERNIYFDFNKYFVNRIYFPTLDSISNVLRIDATFKISIYAFTDSIGKKSYNLELSAKRANSVKNYFLGKGINNKRIKIIPMGDELPTYNNVQNSSIEMDRRASIFLLSN